MSTPQSAMGLSKATGGGLPFEAQAAGVGQQKGPSGGAATTEAQQISGLAEQVAQMGVAEAPEAQFQPPTPRAAEAGQEAPLDVAGLPSGYDEAGELMLHSERAWGEAWGNCDAATLRSLLADDAVLHADGLVLEEDVRGAQAIADACDVRYTWQHNDIARAACAESHTAFALWQDEDVRRAGEGQPQMDPAVVGMWKLHLAEGGAEQEAGGPRYRVKEVLMLRQLNAEENAHRDPGRLVHPHLTASRERMDAMRAAGGGGGWGLGLQEGATELAESILKPDLRTADLLHGGVLEGRGPFCEQIRQARPSNSLWPVPCSNRGQTYQGWHPESSHIDVAVTPNSNKAFVHWSATGHVVRAGGKEGLRASVYGLTLLVFDPHDLLIQETLGMRQLFPGERERLLKAGPLVDVLRGNGGGGY
eukprot:scaffold7.g3406.t1